MQSRPTRARYWNYKAALFPREQLKMPLDLTAGGIAQKRYNHIQIIAHTFPFVWQNGSP
jgi:hypothetical protein